MCEAHQEPCGKEGSLWWEGSEGAGHTQLGCVILGVAQLPSVITQSPDSGLPRARPRAEHLPHKIGKPRF